MKTSAPRSDPWGRVDNRPFEHSPVPHDMYVNESTTRHLPGGVLEAIEAKSQRGGLEGRTAAVVDPDEGLPSRSDD